MGRFQRDNRGSFSRDRRPDDRSRGFGRGGDRQMFSAICSNCGKECQVPFRPTNGKPVYCSECFEKMSGGRRQDGPRNSSPSNQYSPDFKAQFDAINNKLDRIIKALSVESTPEPEIVSEEVPAKKEKSSKSKKTSSK